MSKTCVGKKTNCQSHSEADVVVVEPAKATPGPEVYLSGVGAKDEPLGKQEFFCHHDVTNGQHSRKTFKHC